MSTSAKQSNSFIILLLALIWHNHCSILLQSYCISCFLKYVCKSQIEQHFQNFVTLSDLVQTRLNPPKSYCINCFFKYVYKSQIERLFWYFVTGSDLVQTQLNPPKSYCISCFLGMSTRAK